MPVIAVVEGDGIGREVVPPAKAVLECVRPDLEFVDVEMGAARREREGSAYERADLETLRHADAILFGAVTTVPGQRSVVLTIRKTLDLYANVRPVRAHGVDITIVRENTEGLYSGIEWRVPDRACTIRVVSVAATRRIARFACGIARHLTIGNKANVLGSDRLFVEICGEEARNAGIPCQERYIDALSLDVLVHPASYDVIVTTNMFGDILSDVASYLAGGLGMVPSANIGDEAALFEPVHGSAPDIAGKGIANPVAAIRSAGMLLDHLGDAPGAAAVEEAVMAVLDAGITTPDFGGTAGTREVADAILSALRRHPAVRR